MTSAKRGRTRLTDREAVEVGGLRLLGFKPNEIAKMYGLPLVTVYAITAGRSRSAAVDIELVLSVIDSATNV